MKQKKEDLRLALEEFENNSGDGRIRTLSNNMKRNMTPQESKLYRLLFKQTGIPVIRQKVIGKYIADFFVPPDTVIELDGSQHFSEKGEERDKIRDEFMRSQGYTVLRYANSDVDRNFEAVCEDILAKIK